MFWKKKKNKQAFNLLGAQVDLTDTLNETMQYETELDKIIKEKNLAILKNNNIPFIENMLFVPRDFNTILQNPEYYLQRAICDLFISGICSTCLNYFSGKPKLSEIQNFCDSMLNNFNILYGIEQYLSEFDKEVYNLMRTFKLSKDEVLEFALRYERTYIYFWALGFMPQPDSQKQNDAGYLFSFAFNTNYNELKESMKLKSKAEILQLGNLICRLNWACEEASLKGFALPLKYEVVYQQKEALSVLLTWNI